MGIGEQAIADLQKQGEAPRLLYMIALLAHSYSRMGRKEEALGMLNEALAHVAVGAVTRDVLRSFPGRRLRVAETRSLPSRSPVF